MNKKVTRAERLRLRLERKEINAHTTLGKRVRDDSPVEWKRVILQRRESEKHERLQNEMKQLELKRTLLQRATSNEKMYLDSIRDEIDEMIEQRENMREDIEGMYADMEQMYADMRQMRDQARDYMRACMSSTAFTSTPASTTTSTSASTPASAFMPTPTPTPTTTSTPASTPTPTPTSTFIPASTPRRAKIGGLVPSTHIPKITSIFWFFYQENPIILAEYDWYLRKFKRGVGPGGKLYNLPIGWVYIDGKYMSAHYSTYRHTLLPKMYDNDSDVWRHEHRKSNGEWMYCSLNHMRYNLNPLRNCR